MIKVFLVEDEIIIREGIRYNIDWEKEGFEFVGEDRKSTRLNSSH